MRYYILFFFLLGISSVYSGVLPDSININYQGGVNYARAQTREDMSCNFHASSCMLKDSTEIIEILQIIENQDLICRMQYDTKHVSKSALLVKKTANRDNFIVWFDDDKTHIIAQLILFFPNDEFDLIWVSPMYTFKGWYKFKTNKTLIIKIRKFIYGNDDHSEQFLY